MAVKTILAVEDDRDILRLIRYNFEREGYRVLTSADGEAGLAAARRDRPDLILLDIMIPRLDGLEFCRILRQESAVPILFLTAKGGETDRILGLRLGADDYVTKPFSVGELLARVQAVLRRSEGGAKPSAPVRIGGLELDFERHEVRLKSKPVNLTPKELEFLRLLVEADGKVLSREVLLEKVWGYDRSIDIDTRTVDQHIARMRRKLGSESARILTVPGSGYRLRTT